MGSLAPLRPLTPPYASYAPLRPLTPLHPLHPLTPLHSLTSHGVRLPVPSSPGFPYCLPCVSTMRRSVLQECNQYVIERPHVDIIVEDGMLLHHLERC